MIAEITIILPITTSTSRKATSTARETTLPKGLNVRINTSLLTKNPELTIVAAMTTSMRTSTLKKIMSPTVTAKLGNARLQYAYYC